MLASCNFGKYNTITVYNPEDPDDYFIFIPADNYGFTIRLFEHEVKPDRLLSYEAELKLDLKHEWIQGTLHVNVKRTITYELRINDKTEIYNDPARIIFEEESFNTRAFFLFLKKCREEIRSDIRAYNLKSVGYEHLENKQYSFKIEPTDKYSESVPPYYLFLDVETDGLPKNYNAPASDSDNWPRIVQIAWIKSDYKGNILEEYSTLIKPLGFSISKESTSIHGITNERAHREGVELRGIIAYYGGLQTLIEEAAYVVGHNIDEFDMKVIAAEVYREYDYEKLDIRSVKTVDTMKVGTNHYGRESAFGGRHYISLSDLYLILCNAGLENAHDALSDVRAAYRCFFQMKHFNLIHE